MGPLLRLIGRPEGDATGRDCRRPPPVAMYEPTQLSGDDGMIE